MRIGDPEHRAQWDQMCAEIEAILLKYRTVILPDESIDDHHDCDDDDCTWHASPPDWDNMIVALGDWSMVFSIQDTNPDASQRGHWVLHIEPRHQLPYRTRGLLENRIEMLP